MTPRALSRTSNRSADSGHSRLAAEAHPQTKAALEKTRPCSTRSRRVLVEVSAIHALLALIHDRHIPDAERCRIRIAKELKRQVHATSAQLQAVPVLIVPDVETTSRLGNSHHLSHECERFGLIAGGRV